MHTTLITQIKAMLSDRKFAFLIGAIIMMMIGFCLMMVLSVQPKDILVASRYTEFGDTHYYRDRWYYLYSFVVLAIVMAISHIVLMAKIHSLGRRSGAFMMGGLTLMLFVVAFAYAHQIIMTAFL